MPRLLSPRTARMCADQMGRADLDRASYPSASIASATLPTAAAGIAVAASSSPLIFTSPVPELGGLAGFRELIPSV